MKRTTHEEAGTRQGLSAQVKAWGTHLLARRHARAKGKTKMGRSQGASTSRLLARGGEAQGETVDLEQMMLQSYGEGRSYTEGRTHARNEKSGLHASERSSGLRANREGKRRDLARISRDKRGALDGEKRNLTIPRGKKRYGRGCPGSGGSV